MSCRAGELVAWAVTVIAPTVTCTAQGVPLKRVMPLVGRSRVARHPLTSVQIGTFKSVLKSDGGVRTGRYSGLLLRARV